MAGSWPAEEPGRKRWAPTFPASRDMRQDETGRKSKLQVLCEYVHKGTQQQRRPDGGDAGAAGRAVPERHGRRDICRQWDGTIPKPDDGRVGARMVVEGGRADRQQMRNGHSGRIVSRACTQVTCLLFSPARRDTRRSDRISIPGRSSWGTRCHPFAVAGYGHRPPGGWAGAAGWPGQARPRPSGEEEEQEEKGKGEGGSGGRTRLYPGLASPFPITASPPGGGRGETRAVRSPARGQGRRGGGGDGGGDVDKRRDPTEDRGQQPTMEGHAQATSTSEGREHHWDRRRRRRASLLGRPASDKVGKARPVLARLL
ncbi:hypothetical protein VFPFJ_08571 [Purpureocillium lilacinum]|uniref:Uncharacterized protein n=1 Tax=Purpureocillium lilacinum TaxID=33203 RepID=A0A179GZ89_PURLI|nr:hypothetical protein VFPFJ_08571 [Purpureocillium lilacinum]OAQ82768.1 hypothetical protein VFPFJ_08571 [Purpureocillium lilacinum]